MSYSDNISELISKINNQGQIKISVKEHNSNPPTQASSNFLANKEQGDWAEQTILNAINNNSNDYVAVIYGLGDDSVAGEKQFVSFFNKYQDELNSIGKRPDILIFKKDDYDISLGYDIRNLDMESLDELVPKAVSGLEIRSSSFLIEKYDQYMNNKINSAKDIISQARMKILDEYGDILKSKNPTIYEIIENRLLNDDDLENINFRCPSWNSTTELAELSKNLKSIKSCLEDIQKRTYLSITPKMEDLALVERWINRYNVKHYYIQVFFDKAYGISFEEILNMLLDPEKEGSDYTIEEDVKNQFKTTVKINTHITNPVAAKIDIPEHYSNMRELDRGRLLFYVKFKTSTAYLDAEEFNHLLGYELIIH